MTFLNLVCHFSISDIRDVDVDLTSINDYMSNDMRMECSESLRPTT